MPRQKVIRESDSLFHVSARFNNREWFGIKPEQLWTIYEDYLFLIQRLYDLEIHAFLLMNNHFHLLVRTPNANLPEAMRYFMRETSRVIGFESNRINHIYGGPYHSSLIDDSNYYFSVYKYILRNPIKAKICKNVEDYKFSTLHGLLGKSKLHITIIGNNELFENPYRTLKWLNDPPPSEKDDVIASALKRGVFKPFPCRKSGKMLNFEEDLQM
jgi:putative transposase